MAFEYVNPHNRNLECTMHRPIGAIFVPMGCFVPTPEQEAVGITAETFKEFVTPSFLRPTPPALRRRLLQAIGLPIPESILAITSHLAEFGGRVDRTAQEATNSLLESFRPEPTKVEAPKEEPKAPVVSQVVTSAKSRAPESSKILKEDVKAQSNQDGIRDFVNAATSSFSFKRRRPRSSK